jgi:hypothetical protein
LYCFPDFLLVFTQYFPPLEPTSILSPSQGHLAGFLSSLTEDIFDAEAFLAVVSPQD